LQQSVLVVRGSWVRLVPGCPHRSRCWGTRCTSPTRGSGTWAGPTRPRESCARCLLRVLPFIKIYYSHNFYISLKVSYLSFKHPWWKVTPPYKELRGGGSNGYIKTILDTVPVAAQVQCHKGFILPYTTLRTESTPSEACSRKRRAKPSSPGPGPTPLPPPFDRLASLLHSISVGGGGKYQCPGPRPPNDPSARMPNGN